MSDSTSLEQPTPELPPALGLGPSPFWPQHLVDLFIRPTRFFEGQLGLGKTPYVILVSWALGIAGVLDRIDTRIMRAELNQPGQLEGIEGLLDSWPMLWALVLGGGAFAGAFSWWLGGWWCKVRLRWSGAPEPDPKLARLLFVYSSFVYAGPTVLALIGQTALYPDYLTAYHEDIFFSMAIFAMIFWSIATTYRGALALFAVQKGKARLWFVILPIVFFLLVAGGAAALFAAAG